MAGEIIIPIVLWPHPSVNPYGRWARLIPADASHVPSGWYLPSSGAVDYCGALAAEIPPSIHATPNGKVRVRWMTRATLTTGALKLFVATRSIMPNTSNVSGTWDDDLNATDLPIGQDIENQFDISLVTAAQTVGRTLRFRFRRDKADVADTLADAALLLGAWYIADKA